MNNAQLIHQDSGNFEYYTPSEITQMAREVMGGIDLDPASSSIANSKVGSKAFFSEKGLERVWYGRVWMNHPFSRTNNPLWIRKLIDSYKTGIVEQACCITFAATSEVWFRPLLAYPQCFIHGRTHYSLPSGDKKVGATKGSVVTYLGPNVEKFKRVFSEIGTVK